MSRQLLLAALIACVAMSQAAAETAYVTDRLQLGVHIASDTSDRAFTSLKSGEAVEILERNRSYVRVRLADGREGWVRGAFLLDEEPAVLKVARLTAERDRLSAELDSRQGGGGADQAAEMKQLRQEVRQARSQADTAQAELADLSEATVALRAQASRDRFSVSMEWLLISVGSALLLGGFIAWRWFDRLSRNRHGGFRIY